MTSPEEEGGRIYQNVYKSNKWGEGVTELGESLSI